MLFSNSFLCGSFSLTWGKIGWTYNVRGGALRTQEEQAGWTWQLFLPFGLVPNPGSNIFITDPDPDTTLEQAPTQEGGADFLKSD